MVAHAAFARHLHRKDMHHTVSTRHGDTLATVTDDAARLANIVFRLETYLEYLGRGLLLRPIVHTAQSHPRSGIW